MYGGPGKLGRGGGGGRGGAAKRNVHPPSIHRASTATTGRLSVPGSGLRPRGLTATNASSSAGATSSGMGTEETFSLLTGNPLNFAMIIRLAPDLVEEIKRVEEQGGSARIKFDANANNPAGNVVNVGGKDFRFTWSREPGDLCDIYEERKSGDDGNGMLIESGCAWRKLNVQRVLDESTKNHVKMRSEEAERKHKSRKAIILDPGNPSMKSQVKAMAAAETNPWRMGFKQKKEPPFKKQKTESSTGGPLKSMYKSGMSTTTPSKGRHSTSPQLPPPEQSGTPSSPFGKVNSKKGRASINNVLSEPSMDKMTTSEKETRSELITNGGQDKRGCKGEVGKPADLRSMLISLLAESPSGMSLKALEKAVGGVFPNSGKQIEPILKKIATYQAPGKYLLRPGSEVEGFKKPSAADGRSPFHAKHDQPLAPECSFPLSIDGVDLEELGRVDSKSGEAASDSEKIDILHHSPDLSGEKKIYDTERPVGSSSGSGSDSDSESDSSDSESDSGSRSRSRSKSRSPRGRGSGSSDSESDASSNSKEASDQDVDIMTSDDEKELKQLQVSEPRALKSPFPWRTPDGEPGKIGTDEKQDDLDIIDVVELEKDLLDDDQADQMVGATNSVSNKGHRPEEETKHPSTESNEQLESQVSPGQSHAERGNGTQEDLKHEQSVNFDKVSRGKSRKRSNESFSDGKPDRSKRLKTPNLNQPLVAGTRNLPYAGSPLNPFPDTLNIHTPSSAARENSEGTYRKSLETQQKSKRSYDPGSRAKAPAALQRPGNNTESADDSAKYPEKTFTEGAPLHRDKINRKEQTDGSFIKDKRSSKFSKEDVRDKLSTTVDSHYRKPDMLGNFKEAGSVPEMGMLYSSKDQNANDVHKTPVENFRGSNLRREPSELEVGELREPLPEENPHSGKKFDRTGSFKQSESQQTSAEYWNSDSTQGKPTGRVASDYRETPPPNASKAASSVLEGSKRRSLDRYANDSKRYHHGKVQPQSDETQSKRVRPESGSQYNKLVEANSENRENDASMGLGAVSLLQQHDSRRGAVPLLSRENKKPPSSTFMEFKDRRKDTSLPEKNGGGQRRRESSSDENSCSYSKYEKEEPELKGPIKDFSQYEEYVHEYNEKYASYLSLNKILESYRNEFSQIGRDLEASRGKDMEKYSDLLAQLKESYRQNGAKHKKLKKIFLVLHEELKHLKQVIKDFAAPHLKD